MLSLSCPKLRPVMHTAPSIASRAELRVKKLVEDHERDDVAGHRSLVERGVDPDQTVFGAVGAEADRAAAKTAVSPGPADLPRECSCKPAAILYREQGRQVVVPAAGPRDQRSTSPGRLQTKTLGGSSHASPRVGVSGANQRGGGFDDFVVDQGELLLHSDPENPRLEAPPRDECSSVVGGDQIDRLPQSKSEPAVKILDEAHGYGGLGRDHFRQGTIQGQRKPQLERSGSGQQEHEDGAAQRCEDRPANLTIRRLPSADL